MAFRYQAIDTQGHTVSDAVEAASFHEAAELLRGQGLFVTRLEAGEPQEQAAPRRRQVKPGGKLKDVLFFTQQMAMLIRSGARVVQALEAIESQTARACWRAVVASVRTDVEEGRPLSTALSAFPRLFPAVYVNMVAAGEASGNMSLAFDRLARMTRQQAEIRSRIVGAMTYPAVLMTLCVSVLLTLFTVVLPRFAEMFESLDVPLPTTTAILIKSSRWVGTHIPLVVMAVAFVVGVTVTGLRSLPGRRFISRACIRVPLFGVIVRNVILARVCRIWGQLLDSKVGLVEAVHLTAQSTNSLDFQELLGEVAEAVTGGNSVGPPLQRTWLLPRTFAAAIITGEESGKLADALLFVAECLEDENTQVLSSLSRVIEPLMLVLMGSIVGTVAVSLFLPMFDMATVVGQ